MGGRRGGAVINELVGRERKGPAQWRQAGGPRWFGADCCTIMLRRPTSSALFSTPNSAPNRQCQLAHQLDGWHL